MSLVSTKKLFKKALKEKYAIGAFNINNLEIAQAVINAAVKTQSPVILQVSKGAREYAGIEYLVSIVKTATKKHKNLVAVLHQDHGPDFKTCKTAIQAGFTSVMIDGSNLSFDENVKLTKQVVDFAHKKNVPVEAELGQLIGEQFDAGEGGEESEGEYTDPQKAKDFVKLTQCDSLAVSIGTSHGAYKFEGKPHLDLKRLKKIHKEIPNTPLVLHGASSVLQKYVKQANNNGAKLEGAKGVPEKIIKKATKYGIVKVNIDTDLRLAMLATIREYMAKNPEKFDPRKYLGAARDELENLVVHKLKILGSFGKAKN